MQHKQSGHYIDGTRISYLQGPGIEFVAASLKKANIIFQENEQTAFSRELFFHEELLLLLLQDEIRVGIVVLCAKDHSVVVAAPPFLNPWVTQHHQVFYDQ